MELGQRKNIATSIVAPHGAEKGLRLGACDTSNPAAQPIFSTLPAMPEPRPCDAGGRPITDLQGMRDAAVALHALGPALVLVKGGHLVDAAAGGRAVDVAYDGHRTEEFSAEVIRWLSWAQAVKPHSPNRTGNKIRFHGQSSALVRVEKGFGTRPWPWNCSFLGQGCPCSAFRGAIT